jgi:Uma2 family endonuclease
MTERMNYRVKIIYPDRTDEYECYVYTLYGEWLQLHYTNDEKLILPLRDAVMIKVERI